jgi:hypothetical protein
LAKLISGRGIATSKEDHDDHSHSGFFSSDYDFDQKNESKLMTGKSMIGDMGKKRKQSDLELISKTADSGKT